jgi:hypothetical protein
VGNLRLLLGSEVGCEAFDGFVSALPRSLALPYHHHGLSPCFVDRGGELSINVALPGLGGELLRDSCELPLLRRSAFEDRGCGSQSPWCAPPEDLA